MYACSALSLSHSPWTAWQALLWRATAWFWVTHLWDIIPWSHAILTRAGVSDMLDRESSSSAAGRKKENENKVSSCFSCSEHNHSEQFKQKNSRESKWKNRQNSITLNQLGWRGWSGEKKFTCSDQRKRWWLSVSRVECTVASLVVDCFCQGWMGTRIGL